jgi:hypothetical protein
MTGSTRIVATVVAVATLALLALTAGASTARASQSCGIFNAAGHTWIVVSKGVTCASAKRAVRNLAARTAALHAGQRKTVPSPLRGFVCLIASQGKPGGSCSTAGAGRSILWLSAR